MAWVLVGTFFLIVDGLLCCGFGRRDITHLDTSYEDIYPAHEGFTIMAYLSAKGTIFKHHHLGCGII